MAEVYIGLGGNLGNSRAIMLAALHDMEELPGYHELARSGCWLSAPLGGPAGQPYFYNAVVRANYSGSADKLLKELLHIEDSHGRRRLQINGPRTLDLDILLFGQMIINEPSLSVPHPRLGQRAFVLLPLMQLNQHLPVPGSNCSVLELWQGLAAAQQQIIKEVSWVI